MTEHQTLLNELRVLVAHWTSDPPSRERLIGLLARIRGTMEEGDGT